AAGISGDEWAGAEVVTSPAARPAGVNQHCAAGEGEFVEGPRADGSLLRRLDRYPLQVRQLLQGHARQVGPIRMSVEGGVHIGASVSPKFVRRDLKRRPWRI